MYHQLLRLEIWDISRLPDDLSIDGLRIKLGSCVSAHALKASLGVGHGRDLYNVLLEKLLMALLKKKIGRGGN